MTEEREGYRIVRTWLYATPYERVLRRTLGQVTFMVSSILLGTPRLGPVDLVVVSSPTFPSILSARLIARLKRAKLVVEVRDLYPAVAVEAGIIRNRTLIRMLESIELSSYRAAELVVVTSQGFADHIVARGIDERKVKVITNGVDVERFDRPADVRATRERLGATDNEVLVLYIGNHGLLYALPSVADVARELRDQPLRFAFVGDGPCKQELAERVARLRLENVTLVPSVPVDDVPPMIQAADICLLPLRDIPIVERTIFAKTFEYMAAGKAIVGSLRGETADILRRAGAAVVPPEDAPSLASAIRALAADPSERARMGKEALAYARENYDRSVQARSYRKLLEQAVTPYRAPKSRR